MALLHQIMCTEHALDKSRSIIRVFLWHLMFFNNGLLAKCSMNRILVFSFLLPALAFGADLKDVVRDVAISKMSVITTIYDQKAEVVYIGIVDSCEAVSIMWPRERIENFRVCDGDVLPRNTVSPAWNDNLGHTVLSSVVNNAIMYGQANQDDNGYMISARSLNAISDACKNIEVIVSYDGDLIDRAVRKVCGK